MKPLNGLRSRRQRRLCRIALSDARTGNCRSSWRNRAPCDRYRYDRPANPRGAVELAEKNP